MKKILCIFLVIALALTFVACGTQIDDIPADDTNKDNVENTPETEENNEPDAPDGYPFELGFIEDNGLEYIWEQLDEDTRYNLGEIMNAIRKVDVYCSLSVGLPQEELSEFLELVSNCSTAYTYTGNRFKGHTDDSGRIVGITLSYKVDYVEEAARRTEALMSAIEHAVANVPDGSDYEKIKYLHDFLVLNCDYNEDATSPFTAFGALVEGRATCQGYADAMHLLLTKAGFDTVFTTGIGDSAAVKHKWNYVKTSDGTWYIVDPTWDDPKGKEDKSYIAYDYFMISEQMLLTDHQETFVSPYYTLPAAESMELNYHIVSGYYASNFDEVVSIIKAQATEAVKNGEKYIYLRCADKTLFDEANERLFQGDYEMQKILIDVKDETGVDSLVTNSWTKVVKEGPCTMTITIKYE